jgi:hypothetical protein
MPDRADRRRMAVTAMDAVLIWGVRLLLAALLTGSASLLAALVLLVRDAEGDLRRALGNIAMWSFAFLGLLLAAMLVLIAMRGISRMLSNALSRRRHLVPSRSGENQDGGL